MSKTVTRIGVLSDTHFQHVHEMKSSFLDELKTFDLVIHLGDFVSPDLVEYFRSFNNFFGIAGNHDTQTVKKILPKTHVIEVNGKRLGLLHGYWSPFFCQHRSLARFKKDKVDAILYGHTHIIRNEVAHNILFFNPGSASALWPAPWRTYGILNIGESVTGEIVSMPGEAMRSFSKLTDSLVKRTQVLKWICGKDRVPDSHLGSVTKGTLEI